MPYRNKGMITLEEWNRSMKAKKYPKISAFGIECANPECRAKIFDTDIFIIVTHQPPKRVVKCHLCGNIDSREVV